MRTPQPFTYRQQVLLDALLDAYWAARDAGRMMMAEDELLPMLVRMLKEFGLDLIVASSVARVLSKSRATTVSEAYEEVVRIA